MRRERNEGDVTNRGYITEKRSIWHSPNGTRRIVLRETDKERRGKRNRNRHETSKRQRYKER